ncbi:3-keto-5-aminohexanoate cleavage enzyme [Sporomusa acidovorans DSM 3132]|uniref:3-keto-5-aminohexanoate cleavage enzyme n=2 Tax=Sporomusa TaxID=2375 RepID=A0ABZ3IYQ5_SPOA4|nr:3-keto-5-aminohexanoate cleavage protein [Sporomusa acidovorans]OZC22176.1 3-keto-5-aminohexanoate cleavage enzyme [Sporomusa acidovorans DSM 3132]SDE82130.1 Uncharacterized conserved protein, DUF849 family [Sporomusa acidovorans]
MQNDRKLIINAALTGLVPQKADTPYVPITIDEIVKDGILCYKAGASMLHIHARHENGKPAYEKEIYKEILSGIREACPNVVIAVTTSYRVHKDFDCRTEVLSLEGSAKPDMASLTLGSLNFRNSVSITEPAEIQRLISIMKERDIKPEIELFDSGMVNYLSYLIRKKILEFPIYANFILGNIATAQASVSDVAYLVNMLPEGVIWGGAGIGVNQLMANASAIIMGGHVRVGLEDNLYYDMAKTELATNEQLVKRVVEIAKLFQREIADPLYVRNLLGLNSNIS